MRSVEYQGEWWVPSEEGRDESVAGTLKFEPEEGGRLSLVGTFESLGLNYRGKIDYIHGATTDGKRITLEDCIVRPSGFSSGVSTQYCIFRKAFTGVLFSEQGLKLDKVCFSLPLLNTWAAKNLFQLSDDLRGAEIEKNETEEVQLEEAKIQFKIVPSIDTELWESIEFTQQAYFCIENNETAYFDGYRKNYIRPIQHFIALATAEPVTPSDATGHFTHEGERYKVDIFYQVSFSPTFTETKNSEDIPFSKEKVDYEEALHNWFEHARKNATLHNLYFSTRYNKNMFVDNQFLSLVIALESYHNYLFPEYELMEKGEYNELTEELLETIPEDAEAKERIDNLLDSIGNEPSLGDKLQMIFQEYEDVLTDLINDLDQVRKDARDMRHEIAHGLSSERDIHEMQDLADKLQVIIEAILLREIGLNSTVIKEAMENNRKYVLNN